MSDDWADDVENPVTRWVFITGDRRGVAAALTLLITGLAALLVALELVYVGPGSNLAGALSSGLISGLFTLITVTLAINQLILSRVFGSAGSLFDDLESTLSYRGTVESAAGLDVSPNDPSEFLGMLGDALADRAAALERELDDATVAFETGDDPASLTTAVSAYGDHLATASELSDTFKVLLLTLGTDYAEHIDATREFQSKYGDELPAAADATLSDVMDLLTGAATMRQFFKTLTLQQELATLSRQLIYTGVPALLVTYFLSLVYTASPSVPTAISPSWLPVTVVVATGVIFTPLAILVASLLRIATVSLYSVSVGTFIPPESTFDSG